MSSIITPNLSHLRRKRSFPAFGDLAAMAQELIGEHAGNHGFADRNGANSNARVVAAFCRDFGLGAEAIDGEARCQNRGGRLDRETRDDRLAGRDSAEYPARVVRQKKRRAVLAPADLVGIGIAGKSGGGETVADLDALDRVDRNKSACQFRVELAIDWRAPARRHVLGHDLDDSADGGPRLADASER